MSAATAVVAGAVVGLVAALLGVPLVLRDLSMFGFGLAHAAFGGVALGLALGVNPALLGVAVALFGAVALGELRDHAGVRDETALAAVTLGGLGVGFAVVSAGGVPRPEIVSILFGNPLSAGGPDLVELGILAAVTLGGFGLLYKEILFATFDREAASLAGVPVALLDAGLMALTAVTVVVSAGVAGLLLVGSLLVLPPAAGLRLGRTFRGAVLAAAVAGVVAGGGGVAGAWALGMDNGAPVVLAGLVVLGIGAVGGSLRGARGPR